MTAESYRSWLPVYAENVRDSAIFRSDFKHALEAKYTKKDAIMLLRVKRLELIKGIGSDCDATVLEHLKESSPA